MTMGRIAEELGCDRGAGPAHRRHAVRLRRPVLRHRHRVQHQPASRHQPVRLRGRQPWDWRGSPSRSTSSSRGYRPRRGAFERVLRRGPVPVSGLGARSAAGGRPFRAICRRRSDGRKRSIASTSGCSPSASPASTSSASTGRGGRRRAFRNPSSRAPRATESARPSRSPSAGPGSAPRERSTRAASGPRACPQDTASPARRSSRNRRRPWSSIPGWLATVTDTGDYLMS